MPVILLFITLLLTSGCSKSLKEKIGITTSGPNEYKVQRNKSLEIPPHYDLPPVMPGARVVEQIPEHISTTTTNLNNGEKALINDINSR